MSGEPQVTHAFSYAVNPNSGKVHLVAVTRGRIALSGEGCQVDDMSDPPRLISDDEAWAAFRASPASWCGHCLVPAGPGEDIEGAPV